MAEERTQETWVEFRITSKKPGENRWRFRSATRTKLSLRNEEGIDELEVLTRWVEYHAEKSPGWEFKIQRRTVSQIRWETKWEDV